MIFALSGGTFEAILEGAPTNLVGTVGIRLIDPPSGDVIIERRTTDIVEEPAGSGVYATEGQIPEDLDIGDYLIVWDTVPGGAPLTPDTTFTEQLRVTAFVPSGEAGATFASIDDVQARLGRELTSPEIIQASKLLELATYAIAAAAGRDQAWVEAQTTFPGVTRTICVEAVVRVLLNPRGIKFSQKQLGSYGHSETYAGDGQLALTKIEKRDARKAINGASFWSLTMVTPYSGDDVIGADLDFNTGS